MAKCNPNKIKGNVSFTAKNVNASVSFTDKKISSDLCFEVPSGTVPTSQVFDYLLDFTLS